LYGNVNNNVCKLVVAWDRLQLDIYSKFDIVEHQIKNVNIETRKIIHIVTDNK